jgi:phosphatidylinositol alpha-mannosyltransferase
MNILEVENQGSGVPVITTQISTFPELITNGINGFLVPTQDIHLLAKAIHMLAVDPLLRKTKGQANHKKGEEFRADNVVAQLSKIIFPDLVPLRQFE